MRLIENLRDTAESHNRVFIVEIMGRNAGWIALYSGLAAGADLVLIPEEPFNVKDVINFVSNKINHAKELSIIIVVAEGALIKDYGGPITKDAKKDQFGNVMLGGIADYISKEINKVLKVETRACVPAHTIRGGSPTALDRIIPMRLGIAAVDLIKKSEFGFMTALKAGKIVKVPLSKITGKNKNVNISLFNELNVFFT